MIDAAEPMTEATSAYLTLGERILAGDDPAVD